MKVEIKHREQHIATKNIIHQIARRKKKSCQQFSKIDSHEEIKNSSSVCIQSTTKNYFKFCPMVRYLEDAKKYAKEIDIQLNTDADTRIKKINRIKLDSCSCLIITLYVKPATNTYITEIEKFWGNLIQDLNCVVHCTHRLHINFITIAIATFVFK